MTITFLVDTSNTMGVLKTSNRNGDRYKCSSSSIDVARIVVEESIKIIKKTNPIRSIALFQTDDTQNCCIASLGTPIYIVEDKTKNLVVQKKIDSNDVDHKIYTFPLSFILNITNQYRITSDIDRFGYGRSPYLIEPLDIIIITDGGSLKDGINLNNIKAYSLTGNEFQETPLRWDHRIHLFILNTFAQEINIPENIVDLVLSTGGEFIQSGVGLDKTIEKITELINNITTSNFPGIKFVTSNENKLMTLSNARLKFKQIEGEWMIPECINKELIIKRSTIPTLKFDQTNMKDNNNQTKKFLDLAQQLNIGIDTYEIFPFINGQTLAGLEKLEIQSIISIDNDNKNDSGQNFTSLPFAIISKNKKNKLELQVLPYNYPTLLPIVKLAVESKDMQKWRKQFDEYLHVLPGYYYSSINRMMKRLGLGIGVPLNLEYNINRTLVKKLKYIQGIASKEIKLIRAAMFKNITMTLDPMEVAVGAPELQRGLIRTVLEVPKSLSSSSSSSSSILSSLEKMRSVIYGGQQSISCRGLALDGIDGNISHVHNNCTEATVQNDWFGLATGAHITRRLTVNEAGNYLKVLAKRETIREPTSVDDKDIEDENSTNGVLKRKFSVHFGNRYALKTKKQLSTSHFDDGMEFTKESIYKEHSVFMDSPAPHRDSSSTEIDLPPLIPRKRLLLESTLTKIRTVTTTTTPVSPSIIESNLPHGWIEGFSKTHNRPFWFNASTNESVWNRPV